MGADLILAAIPLDVDHAEAFANLASCTGAEVLDAWESVIDSAYEYILPEDLYEEITERGLSDEDEEVALRLHAEPILRKRLEDVLEGWLGLSGPHWRGMASFMLDERVWGFCGGTSWGDTPCEGYDETIVLEHLGVTSRDFQREGLRSV